MRELINKIVRQKGDIITQWVQRTKSFGGSYARVDVSELKDFYAEFIAAFFEALKENNLTQLRIFIDKLCNIRSAQGFRLSEVQRAYCSFTDVVKPIIKDMKAPPREKSKLIDHINDVLLETLFEVSESYHRKLNEKIDGYVDQIEKINEKLKQDSIRDGLTGCYNHRYFQDIISSEASRASRYGRSLTLVMLDIDDFKKLNDTYSHMFGDKVLRSTDETIRNSARDVDTVFRYGGEEFCIIMPDTNKEAAVIGAERINRKIKELNFKVKRKLVAITISCGVAEFVGKRDSKDTLVAHADQALYQAKNQGKDCVVVYHDSD